MNPIRNETRRQPIRRKLRHQRIEELRLRLRQRIPQMRTQPYPRLNSGNGFLDRGRRMPHRHHHPPRPSPGHHGQRAFPLRRQGQQQHRHPQSRRHTLQQPNIRQPHRVSRMTPRIPANRLKKRPLQMKPRHHRRPQPAARHRRVQSRKPLRQHLLGRGDQGRQTRRHPIKPHRRQRMIQRVRRNPAIIEINPGIAIDLKVKQPGGP